MPDYDVLNLKNGGRKEFWLSHAALVGRFVDAHLKDLTKLEVAAHAPVAAAAERAASGRISARPLIWDPTRGGMRMPHLHYAGEIFIMSEPQWSEFSKAAVSGMLEKMKGAQRVSFDEVMQLSEAVAGL